MKKTNEDIIPIIDKQERIEFIKKNLYTMTYDELAPYVGMASGDTVRDFCKRNKLPNKRDNCQARRNNIPLNEKIKQFISIKQRTLSELCNEFNVSPATIEKELKAIKKNNVLIDNIDSAFKLGTTIQVEEEPVSIDTKKYGETEFCFGAVADTHIGSKYERLDALNAIYDRFQEYGIDTVYHGGNWIDGECRFNKFDVYTIGVEDQIKNFVAKYPQRKGIKTFIVSGDDHEGWYVQREHINVGKAMQDEAVRQGRNDLIDVGYMERDFELKQKKGSAILRLIHAGGGSSYALSYTSQKYAESMQGGEKPQIVLVGHYHKFDYSYPREMHIVQIGCFTGNTNITTPNGKVKIKDIKEGDIVLTDKGSFKKVTKKFVRNYEGEYISINYGRKGRPDQTVTCTEEHPIKVKRGNEILFVPANEVVSGDKVFVTTSRCKVCGDVIPFWMKMCSVCNPMDIDGVTEKLSETKGGFKRTRTSDSTGLVHLEKDIIPFCERMSSDGWKIIPVGSGVIPDAIGFKDGKVVAFEVESQKGNHLNFKKRKYIGSPILKFIDEVKWIDITERNEQPRTRYEPYSNDFVLVSVLSVTKKRIKTKKVYNLEVEDDHTYVAGNICVHNCFEDQTPFMRKKRLQAMVGGCVIWVRQNELGIITSCKVEWIPFYGKKFYQYNW